MRRVWLALCFLGLAFVSRAEVPVYAYVVCGTNGTQMAASSATVSEYVKNLNFVFSQVCIDFRLVHYGVITNENWLSICGSNESQCEALCATTNSTGGLELYFVREIDDCTALSMVSDEQCASTSRRANMTSSGICSMLKSDSGNMERVRRHASKEDDEYS